MKPGPKAAVRRTIFRSGRVFSSKPLTEAGNLLTEAEAGRQPKPVVGIPLALHSLEWGVFWAHLFSELGFSGAFEPEDY